MQRDSLVIVGAGPAGLTAGLELARRGERPLVVERAPRVGGMARTEVCQDFRFDIGGHRFLTTLPEVQKLWEELLPEAFLSVSRLSRIYFQGRFFRYPIELGDVIRSVGFREGMRMGGSYFRARMAGHREEETFDQWVSARFGRRLYERFFEGYTEKVWGVPCNRLRAELAAERIQGLSLATALWSALTGRRRLKTLTDRFQYPLLGPGMMWEAFQQKVEALGGEVMLDASVIRLRKEGNRVRSVTVRSEGRDQEIPVSRVLTSAPLRDLVRLMDPAPPPEVMQAAARLAYRDFILVGLVVDRDDLFPDQWIYIHSPDVAVGRIQNFKNWSRSMVPDARMTGLGMEYFCTRGDDLWNRPDHALIDLAGRNLERLGLCGKSDVVWGRVFRQTEAYPVYLLHTPDDVRKVKAYLRGMDNLHSMGRNGLHRYDNQDQAMVTGLQAAGEVLKG